MLKRACEVPLCHAKRVFGDVAQARADERTSRLFAARSRYMSGVMRRAESAPRVRLPASRCCVQHARYVVQKNAYIRYETARGAQKPHRAREAD